jgi:hypothetical protein
MNVFNPTDSHQEPSARESERRGGDGRVDSPKTGAQVLVVEGATWTERPGVVDASVMDVLPGGVARWRAKPCAHELPQGSPPGDRCYCSTQ